MNGTSVSPGGRDDYNAPHPCMAVDCCIGIRNFSFQIRHYLRLSTKTMTADRLPRTNSPLSASCTRIVGRQKSM